MNDLERLARAAFGSNHKPSIIDANWEEKLPEVRAILAAMREPSYEVVAAVATTLSGKWASYFYTGQAKSAITSFISAIEEGL